MQPGFHTQRPLSSRRQEIFEGQILGNPVLPAQALQPRRREDNTIYFAGRNLPQSGIHVPPDTASFQVGADWMELNRPPQTPRRYPGPRSEFIKLRLCHQDVFWVV